MYEGSDHSRSMRRADVPSDNERRGSNAERVLLRRAIYFFGGTALITCLLFAAGVADELAENAPFDGDYRQNGHRAPVVN